VRGDRKKKKKANFKEWAPNYAQGSRKKSANSGEGAFKGKKLEKGEKLSLTHHLSDNNPELQR